MLLTETSSSCTAAMDFCDFVEPHLFAIKRRRRVRPGDVVASLSKYSLSSELIRSISLRLKRSISNIAVRLNIEPDRVEIGFVLARRSSNSCGFFSNNVITLQSATMNGPSTAVSFFAECAERMAT